MTDHVEVEVHDHVHVHVAWLGAPYTGVYTIGCLARMNRWWAADPDVVTVSSVEGEQVGSP